MFVQRRDTPVRTLGFHASNTEAFRIRDLFIKKFVSFDPDYFALLEHPEYNLTSPEFLGAFAEFKAAMDTLPVFA
jgi:hypothetical protein